MPPSLLSLTPFPTCCNQSEDVNKSVISVDNKGGHFFDPDISERLNVRALRCVYNKRVPLHGDDDYGLTLSNRRLQDIAILIFKAVNGMLPKYISDLFVVRNNVKCLRGTNKLVVPRKRTSNFGLKSTTFIGAKVWNSLPDKLRSTKILKEFKKAVRELHL